MVAKLVAIDGPEKGLELILEKGDRWIIGRDPKECDLVLEDPKASRKHAQIRYEDGKYWIKNLSRTNPVVVGDEKLKEEKVLNFNHTLKIGESHFRFSEIKASKKDKDKNETTSEYDELFEDLDEPPVSIDPAKDGPVHKEPEAEDDGHYDTIFQDVGDDDTYGDLSESYLSSERFILKVLSGPNSGAEFAMQKGRSYIIGTDVTGCDIIFNDLSVSRHHARISVTDEEEILIEDLSSRNGVLVDDDLIKSQKQITPKNVTTLGTTTFIIVDREAAEETVVTKLPQLEKEEPEEPQEEEVEPIEEKKSPLQGFVTERTFIFTGVLIAAVLLLGTGLILLFKTSPVEKYHKDYSKNIQHELSEEFPDIRFTYNTSNGEVFVVGHVLNPTQKEELMYKLDNLNYITMVKDDVVVDEYVNQEMNLILDSNPYWQGISLHSPKPGQFVLAGYLPTREANAELADYMNVQFPYVDRLTNYVVVEQDLIQEINSKLYNYGFFNVNVEMTNGEITLGGYVNYKFERALDKVQKEISKIHGVRKVNNFVVMVGKSASGSSKTASRGKKGSEENLLHDPSIINLTDYVTPTGSLSLGYQGGTDYVTPTGSLSLGYQGGEDSVNVSPSFSYQGGGAAAAAGGGMGSSQGYAVTGYAQQEKKLRAVEIDGTILTLGDKLDGMVVIAFEGNFVFLEKNGLKYKIECIK